jgi:hypothetical protein
MKLKEKLARGNCAENLDTNKHCMLCYIAGFEKCREMSQRFLIAHSDWCYTNGLPEAGTHLRSSADSLNLLGEEEEAHK